MNKEMEVYHEAFQVLNNKYQLITVGKKVAVMNMSMNQKNHQTKTHNTIKILMSRKKKNNQNHSVPTKNSNSIPRNERGFKCKQKRQLFYTFKSSSFR